MLKEEMELRNFVVAVIDTRLFGAERRKSSRLITALVRAVREDERKMANEDFLRDRARGIPAIRGKK